MSRKFQRWTTLKPKNHQSLTPTTKSIKIVHYGSSSSSIWPSQSFQSEWIPILNPFHPTPFPPKKTSTSTTTNDSSTSDPETLDYDTGDIAFILVSTALVFLMIPGLAFFYSGLTKGKSALSLLLICLWCVAVVSVQWFLFGYSLVFSQTGSVFIGNFDHAVLLGISGSDPSPLSETIPVTLFFLYQSMFASITPGLVLGSASERFRFIPATAFILLWTTLVYDFLAYWTWNENGWAAGLGGIDFAGGTPVHISAGAAGLAYAIVLGKRHPDDGPQSPSRHDVPHNMASVFLGTGLLWFGWFGFNGGSALAASTQAVYAFISTNLAACVGGLTWVILEFGRHKTFSGLALCTGIISGLVCITPACGFVSPASSLAFGFFGGLFCYIAVSFKPFCGIDDSLDVFAVHGVGAIVGNMLTGVFAQQEYGAPDGGGLDGNWELVVHQLVDTVSGFLWSFVISLVLLFLLNCIPGCKLRVSKQTERVGVDIVEHGQHCYDFIQQGQAHRPLNPYQLPIVPHGSDKIVNAGQNLDNNLQHLKSMHKCTRKTTKYASTQLGPARSFDYESQLQQVYPGNRY